MPQIRCRRCKAGRTGPHGIDILIGPEGGFAEEERANLLRQPQILQAFAGAADPAGRYRRRRGAGAGAGGAGRLDRFRRRWLGRQQPFWPVIKPLGYSQSKPRPGHAKGCALTSGTRFFGIFGLRDDHDRRPSCDRIRRMGGRPAIVVRAGRLRAGRAGYPAAGRAVPGSVGRGHPQEPLSDHRSQRRGTVPAPRPHHSGGAGLSRLRPAPASPRASAISARCSAIAAAGRANSCRPASNPSDGRTAPRRMPKCWRWRWRRPPRSA